MAPGYIVALFGLVTAQLALPKQYGFAPLLIAAAHLGGGEILPELNATRILVIVGLARAYAQKFFVSSSQEPLDRLFALFACVCIFSTVGHKADEWSPSPFANRLGLCLNIVGTYLYGRAYIPNLDGFLRYGRGMLIILIPLAAAMMYEMKTGNRFYGILGAPGGMAVVREDKTRAQGPFGSPNTAGCVGATALPLIFIPWMTRRRTAALIGCAACMGVTVACNSSGPLSAVGITLSAIGLWRFRQYLGYMLWGLGCVCVLYFVVKGRGPWYIMASIDLTGGSTGYYRAELINNGLSKLSEWWLFGTDYTRDWMPTGVSWSPNHTDMTNYYIHLGVIGGLPLSLCLCGMLVYSFRRLGRTMAALRAFNNPNEVMLWAAGTALATHATSFIAISYFDQMHVFFYVLLGAIPGLCATASGTSAPAVEQTVTDPTIKTAPLQPSPRYYS